jgi:hypothetical protein
MPKPIFADLKKAWVCGRKLNIARVDSKGNAREPQQGGTDKKKKGPPAKKKGSNAKANAKTNAKAKDDTNLKKARAIQKRPKTSAGKKSGEENTPAT